MSRRLTLVAENLASNSTGRVYCLWLLARALGHQVRVISSVGDRVWAPLAGSEFAADCELVTPDAFRNGLLAATDIVIACKPLPSSLGQVWSVRPSDRAPLGVDVDDPDLEYRLSVDDPIKAIGKMVLRPRQTAEFRSLRRIARELPTVVSNPWLQARYGGVVIPHVRLDTGVGKPHTSRTPHVAFVGSNKPHKGVDALRKAIATVQDEGFVLTVTDDPPQDAQPWERWVGRTSIEVGLEILGDADIAVIASDNTADARGQLPAKLMDAMLAGRAVVVSDVAAAPWGLGGTGIVIPPRDLGALIAALREYADPGRRAEAGAAARALAERRYTVESAVDDFRAFLERVELEGK